MQPHRRFLLASMLVLLTTPMRGEDLKIDWDTTDGIERFTFDTGELQGSFIARDTRELGKGFGRHGLRDLTFGPDRIDLQAPEGEVGQKRRHQGHLNLYRVYAGDRTFGSLRDDLAELERLPDGAQLTWTASEERPVEVVASWRLTGPAQIDLEVRATPTENLANFEILPASYCPVEMEKLLYLPRDGKPQAVRVLNPADPEEALTYPFFPLTEADRMPQQNSGRLQSEWKWPTTVQSELAALPIAVAAGEDVEILLFGLPDSTSAVCATPRPDSGSPEDWNSVEKHSALYLSLFCRDAKASETLTTRARLLVRAPTEATARDRLELFQEFLRSTPSR